MPPTILHIIGYPPSLLSHIHFHFHVHIIFPNVAIASTLFYLYLATGIDALFICIRVSTLANATTAIYSARRLRFGSRAEPYILARVPLARAHHTSLAHTPRSLMLSHTRLLLLPTLARDSTPAASISCAFLDPGDFLSQISMIALLSLSLFL